MKKSYKFSRKIRQFKYLAKTLNRLIQSNRFQQLSAGKRQELVAKLQHLHEVVRPYLAGLQVRKTLAGAAIFLGASLGSVQAQFAAPVTNPFNLQGIQGVESPNLVDIDGDGDLDLLTTTYDNDTYLTAVGFYENIGSAESPDFSTTSQMNPFGIDLSLVDQETIFDFDLADMDNDGDLDLLLGSYGENYDGKFFYYENIGTSQAAIFTAPVLNPFGLTNTYQSALPTIIDIDSDGDFDVFAAEYYGNIKYFENTGTQDVPNFAAPIDNPFGINVSDQTDYTLFDLADLDGDGDADFLASLITYDGTGLVYQENTGTAQTPTFGIPSAENPLSYAPNNQEFFIPEMVDLDNDGDIDVLINIANVDTYSSSWLYFENLAFSVATNDLDKTVELQLFPNPVQDLLTVKTNFDNPVNDLTIEIYDASGRQIFMENKEKVHGALNFQTNTSAYASGLYLVKIQADGQFSTLKFLKD